MGVLRIRSKICPVPWGDFGKEKVFVGIDLGQFDQAKMLAEGLENVEVGTKGEYSALLLMSLGP